MRIGIDARFFGGEKAKGLGRYTERLITHLQKIDTINEYYIFLKKEDFERVKFSKNFHPVLADFPWYGIKEQIAMPKLLKKYDLDVAHFPHYNVPALYSGKYIVTIHDLILNHFPTKRASTLKAYLYWAKHLAYLFIIRRAVKKAERIIAVSEFTKKDIETTFRKTKKDIFVTYEGVDIIPPKSAEETKSIRKKYALDDPYILYVGNAYPHKNLETIIDVMALMKESGTLKWKCALVGKEDFFYKRLKERAEKMNVSEEIIFTGFIPDADLPAIYAGAEVFLFLSRYEGFGLPPLESLACGTPVIASNAASLPEVLGDAAIYCDPMDKNGIIKTLEGVMENKKILEKTLGNAKKNQKRFDWRIMAEKTKKIYEQTP